MAAREIEIVKMNGLVDYPRTMGVVNQWLNTCTNGTYTLTLKRKQQKRSVSQNALMWLWFAAIAEAWTEACGYGITSQDVHDAYCMLLIPKDTPKGKVAGSTRMLTTEQMTDFLNRVQADAASEYGITLPNPEDQYFEAWAEQYQQQ